MSIPTKNRLFKLFCIACAFLITRLDADELKHLAHDVDPYDTVQLWDGDVAFDDKDDYSHALDIEDEEVDFGLDEQGEHGLSYEHNRGLELLANLIDDAAAFDAYVASVSAAYGLEDETDDLGPAGRLALSEDDHDMATQGSGQPGAEGGQAQSEDWSLYLPEELMVFGEADMEADAQEGPTEEMEPKAVATEEGVSEVQAEPAEDPFAQESLNAPQEPVMMEQEEAAQEPDPWATEAASDTAMVEDDPFATQTASVEEADLDAIFQKEVGPSVTKGDQETVSIDFADTTIRAVLRNVADIFGLNLAIPDGVVGNVSLKLKNVTWRQVFDLVLEPIGYLRIEDGNIVKIKSREDVMSEPVDTQVFIIDYANVEELKESMESLVDENLGGNVQIDKRANALIITERPSRLNRIGAIIKEIDMPEPQVMIESKFVETQNTNALSLGFSYSDSLTTGVQSPTRTADRVHEYVSDAEQPVNTLHEDFEKKTTFTDKAIFSLPSFEATLNMLRTDGKTKIINNPTVVTLNNKPALITVGKRIPIPNYTYNEERGTYEVTGFKYMDTGTILAVEPRVNMAGFITMIIKPEVSEKGADVQFSTNAAIPEIDAVRTESVVTLKDGFTVAIGGLIRDSDKKENRRVPLLGRIPVIGNLLFRSRNNSRSLRNILIFITARTLNPDGTSYEEIIDPRIMHDMDIKPRDLPGYEIPQETRQRLKALEEQEQAMAHEHMLYSLDQKKASLNDNYQAYLRSTEKMQELDRKRNLHRRRFQRDSVQF